MSEHDDKLDRAYRALATEEPAASLDAAILAASRRAVARPSLARRWAVPVSLAATLVLVIGVTLEMQREQPGVELAPEPPEVAAQRFAPAPAAPLAAPRSGAPAAPSSAKRASAASSTADNAAVDPRGALEKIARLRAEGRDVEADRALDEFRKRHPDYRIDDAMWERVKPR